MNNLYIFPIAGVVLGAAFSFAIAYCVFRRGAIKLIGLEAYSASDKGFQWIRSLTISLALSWWPACLMVSAQDRTQVSAWILGPLALVIGSTAIWRFGEPHPLRDLLGLALWGLAAGVLAIWLFLTLLFWVASLFGSTI